MTTSFESLMTCSDLTRDHVVAALVSREATVALLRRLTCVARSGDATERIFLLLASLAGGYAEWFDAELRVELDPRDTGTVVHTLVELGSGQRERLFSSLSIAVPFEEIEENIRLTLPQLRPLELIPSAHGLVLSTLEDDGGWDDIASRVSVAPASMDPDATAEARALSPSAHPTPVVPGHAPGWASAAAQTPNEPSASHDDDLAIRASLATTEVRRADPDLWPTVRLDGGLTAVHLDSHAPHEAEAALAHENGSNRKTPSFTVSAELIAELRDDDALPNDDE